MSFFEICLESLLRSFDWEAPELGANFTETIQIYVRRLLNTAVGVLGNTLDHNAGEKRNMM